MNGWLGITTVQKASKDRDGDSSGFYFFFRARAWAPQLARHALGRLPTRPLCRKICHSDCTEELPLGSPASTQEVSESENWPATRGTAHSGLQ